MKLVAALLVLLCCATARADAPAAQCLRAPAPPPTEGVPVTWSDFEVEGTLVEAASTVRALFAPTVQRYRALTDAARKDIEDLAAVYGYHVALAARGAKLVLTLSPLPIIRKVTVDVKQDLFDSLVEDEIKRRMRVRVGSYLPWDSNERACTLRDEQDRVAKYLRDEGYFEAELKIVDTTLDAGSELHVKVTLGPPYKVDTRCVKVANAAALDISEADIVAEFKHPRCIIPKLGFTCAGQARFQASPHRDDLETIRKNFQKRGFPSVRVSDNFDDTSFDRRRKRVCFDVAIDQRRKLFVVFEGNNKDSLPDEQLHDQLTFDRNGSSDDVEANESAKALTEYLQTRNYFDARVTWTRERFAAFDRIVYRLEPGRQREVRKIDFVGNHALSDGALDSAIGTQANNLTASLFGAVSTATAIQLAADVERIVDAYRRIGYREARVRVTAAPDDIALESAALAAGLVALDRGAGDLYVRYTIDEGVPTLLDKVQIELGDPTLCKDALVKLAEILDEGALETPLPGDKCMATAPHLAFKEDDVEVAKDKLREWLWSKGRPRSRVDYTSSVIAPHRVAAVFKLTNTMPLKMGHVVIRGNFRTRHSVILDELRFTEGKPLTSDALADAARRLRATGLFEAVILEPVELDTATEGEVNAVVRVEERYDYHASVDLQLGYSSYNGLFFTIIPSAKNLFGLGMSFDIVTTIGINPDVLPKLRLKQLSIEPTFVIPAWLSRRFSPIEFRTELSAFHRLQDTPRFGPLTTDGATIAFAKTRVTQRTDQHPASTQTFGLHYDFRRRERQLDVLRPVGADFDQTQVPITTDTGSIGFAAEWEQRTDRRGVLSPLAPEDGFRLQAQASIAAHLLGGQDTFIKVSAAGSKYWPVGQNLIVHADLRYDQGIPLGGAVLLPDVERFFAGGDTTVRGYDDDRLATEIVQVGVPPYANVNQIRILPAGGNIRAMGSIDAQLRIYKVFATALFTDAGLVTNRWSSVAVTDVRPSIGMALVRIITPFGSFAFERAVPLRPQLGDDPRGRWHISFAARAQF